MPGYPDVGLYVTDPDDPRGEEFDSDSRHWQDRKDYIETIYREELGRGSDAEGLEYWAGTDLQGDVLIKKMREMAGLDNNMYADPAYAVFMRNMRQQEATIEADRSDRQRDLANQQTISNIMLDRQQTKGLGNVDDAAEARGMYRSGGRIRDRAELVTDIASNRATSELGYTEKANALERAADSDLATLSRKRDEQEIASRNTLTNKSIKEAANE